MLQPGQHTRSLIIGHWSGFAFSVSCAQRPVHHNTPQRHHSAGSCRVNPLQRRQLPCKPIAVSAAVHGQNILEREVRPQRRQLPYTPTVVPIAASAALHTQHILRREVAAAAHSGTPTVMPIAASAALHTQNILRREVAADCVSCPARREHSPA